MHSQMRGYTSDPHRGPKRKVSDGRKDIDVGKVNLTGGWASDHDHVSTSIIIGGSAASRRLTRGVVPALNAELEQLMAAGPVSPPEGWGKEYVSAYEDGGPASWECWESRLKEERVPGYVVGTLWQKICEMIQATLWEAARTRDTHPTLTVGQQTHATTPSAPVRTR